MLVYIKIKMSLQRIADKIKCSKTVSFNLFHSSTIYLTKKLQWGGKFVQNDSKVWFFTRFYEKDVRKANLKPDKDTSIRIDCMKNNKILGFF